MYSDVDVLCFSVKAGKSITSGGWSIKRKYSFGLIPKLSYETECDIIVEGVSAKAHLNIEPRIFFSKKQKDFIKHLENLEENNSNGNRIKVQMLLNHNDFLKKCDDFSENVLERKEFEYILRKKDIEIERLSEYVDLLKKENKYLNKKLNEIK